MDELKRRILSDAEVGEGDIIRVDMFLNHCMDMELVEKAGASRARRSPRCSPQRAPASP